jgi:beta-lactamase regulating signal transducer with metallopeptidase domain
MMLPVVLDAAVRAALLLVVILLALKALRVSNPHIQMAAWRMVLAASLSMPVLVALARLALPPHGLSVAEILPADVAAVVAPALVAPSMSVVPPDAGPATVDWLAVGSWLYLAVAGSLVLRWLLGCVLMWRLCRSAGPVREDWTVGHDVRAHPAIAVPATFGSTILLPPSYSRWDATRRRAVLAHEHAHVRCADFYVLALASINRAVFWFSPPAWWLHKRIADLAEARSDAAAIQNIGDRVRYAEILIDFAGGTPRSAAALAMARASTVRHRVERILGESIMPRKMDWKSWAALAGCIVPLTAIAAGAVIVLAPERSMAQGAVPADPIAVRLAEQARPRTEVFVDPKTFDNYVGYYQLDPLKVFTITRLGDRLHAQLTGQEFRPIYPESAQKFFYKGLRRNPAQISFVADQQGRATGLTLHQSGMDRFAKRIDEAEAKAVQEVFAKRLKEPVPMSGSEAALRRQIVAFQQGQPAYHEMSDALAVGTRPQVPGIQKRFAVLGPLRSISFRGVGLDGLDIYEAKFENGMAVCRIYMSDDGKVSGLWLQW